MKKLLLFSVLLVAFACSKEDEASEQSEQTFLEKYDGVAFEGLVSDSPYMSGRTIAVFFYNSEVFLKEYKSYVYIDPPTLNSPGSPSHNKLIEICRELSEGIDEENQWSYGAETKIVVNSSTTLAYKRGDWTYTYTVDASGRHLKYEADDNYEDRSYHDNQFIKSDSKYSDYCN